MLRAGFVGQQDPLMSMVLQSSESLDGHGGMEVIMLMSPLHHPSPQLHLFTDLSLEDWGGGAHMDSHMASNFWFIILLHSSIFLQI